MDICNSYIVAFVIDPSFQRRGLGQYLLNKTIELIVDNIGCVYASLHVNAQNKAAINLYKKCGFIVYEKLNDFYETQQYGTTDAYLMKKYGWMRKSTDTLSNLDDLTSKDLKILCRNRDIGKITSKKLMLDILKHCNPNSPKFTPMIKKQLACELRARGVQTKSAMSKNDMVQRLRDFRRF